MANEALNTTRFNRFLADFERVIDTADGDEAVVLAKGGDCLHELVSHDDWLPAFCTQPHPEYYQQYLLYCYPRERYSVVSFVWGPGQCTPVHNHTVWGLIGMLRGSEKAVSYD